MSAQRVYLDNHATTQVDPRVVEAMLPYFTEMYGNPGSVNHEFGWEAKAAVDRARQSIARAIGGDASEVIFTSGATESNNLAIRGVAERTRRKGNHLVSVCTEHKAVLDPLARLARRGYQTTLLEVAPFDSPQAGLVDLDQLAAAISDQTLLVSVMLANNEIGVLQPLAEIGALCRERNVLLHCDATQAVGKIPVDVRALQIDLMSFSAHKMYGPKGVGGLYVRKGTPAVRLDPQISGGGHERGLRSGTLNVPGIVGLAKALELCILERESEADRQRSLRDQLYQGLTENIAGVSLNGPPLEAAELRLPGNLNVRFEGVDGDALLMNMPSVGVSSGAACTSANPEPSHVLRALGLSEDATRSSLRFGLGRFNTAEDIALAMEQVQASVAKLRGLTSPR